MCVSLTKLTPSFFLLLQAKIQTNSQHLSMIPLTLYSLIPLPFTSYNFFSVSSITQQVVSTSSSLKAAPRYYLTQVSSLLLSFPSPTDPYAVASPTPSHSATRSVFLIPYLSTTTSPTSCRNVIYTTQPTETDPSLPV